MSNFDLESTAFYVTTKDPTANLANDPLGISSSGNMPGIVNAFKQSGHVCMERTLSILNRA